MQQQPKTTLSQMDFANSLFLNQSIFANIFQYTYMLFFKRQVERLSKVRLHYGLEDHFKNSQDIRHGHKKEQRRSIPSEA